MKIYFILSILVALYYIFYKSKKYMHMLQQNWYNDGNRYLNWIIDNNKKVFINLDILFLVFILLYFIKNEIVSIVFFVLLYMICYKVLEGKYKSEQSKKPLVYTSRIKRLYVTMLIIYLLCIVPMILCFSDSIIDKYYFLIGFMIYINPFVIMCANTINTPIEKMVFNHYKRLAKDKLESMNNLKKVAITGSYGKTSTKNALNDILNVKYNSFATEKSFNTMNGLMISINNKLDKFTDIFIAEMGAFRRGEIKEKCDFIKPQYGILTTIGTAH